MKKILVFQHSSAETLGVLEKELQLQNMEAEIVNVKERTLPQGEELEGYGALIILGGENGVYQKDRLPWLRRELEAIQEVLRRKKPILGICLGAQMLAHAAGARVTKGPKKEMGWGWIHFDDWFSKRNPLTFQLDLNKRHMVFHWHEDTFDFPIEGYRLAWNDNYPAQMFCTQGNAIGIQFHPEVTDEMIRTWVEHSRSELIKSKIDPGQILKETSKHLPDLQKMCHHFFYGFASLIRENVRQTS